MATRLSYFAWVRERMGVGEETVDLPSDVRNVAALVRWLAARDERSSRAFAEPARIRAAVDGVMAGHDASIADAAEVALFPPVTGG